MLMSVVLIVLIVLAAVFSVQNAAPVTMSFFAWNFQASLALVVLMSLLSGMVIASIFYSILRLKSALRKKQEQPPQNQTKA